MFGIFTVLDLSVCIYCMYVVCVYGMLVSVCVCVCCGICSMVCDAGYMYTCVHVCVHIHAEYFMDALS